MSFLNRIIEADIIKVFVYHPYDHMTAKDIKEITGLPERSLEIALKNLKGEVLVNDKKGWKLNTKLDKIRYGLIDYSNLIHSD